MAGKIYNKKEARENGKESSLSARAKVMNKVQNLKTDTKKKKFFWLSDVEERITGIIIRVNHSYKRHRLERHKYLKYIN
jgi:hypothetical protein